MPTNLKGNRICVAGHDPVHGGPALIAWLLDRGAAVTVAGATAGDDTLALQRRVDEQLKRSARDGKTYSAMRARLNWTARRSAGTADALQLFAAAWPRRIIGIGGGSGKTTSVLWSAHLIGDAVAVGYSPERPYIAALSARAKVAVAEVSGAPLRGAARYAHLTTDDGARASVTDPILSRLDREAFTDQWGAHNFSNLATAVAAARLAGVRAADIVRRIASLPQVPYRQEVVRKDAKLTVVNDATASTPAAGIAALARWGGPTTVLIAGGCGASGDYALWAKQLAESIRKTNVLLLTGDATRAMRSALRRSGYTVPAFGTLAAAWDVALMRARTYVSATVLFSPAALGPAGVTHLDLGRELNELARR